MAMKLYIKHETLSESLEHLLKDCPKDKCSLKEIFRHLAGRGYAAILVLFSIPFCLPITIPGVSTLFGLTMAFIGLRVAFGKRLWWPQWLLAKEISFDTLEKIVKNVLWVIAKLKKFLHPRWTMLVYQPLLHRMHGLIICALSLLLALPLPIPFTNMLAAVPILLIALGILEDDGLCIIIGYLFAFVGFAAFFFMFYFGKEGLKHLIGFF